jgi:hypothetical protein
MCFRLTVHQTSFFGGLPVVNRHNRQTAALPDQADPLSIKGSLY